MLDRSALKECLSRTDLTRSDKVLLILAVDSNSPKQVAQIRGIANETGLPKAKRWNLSDILAHSGGLAVRVKEGWELSGTGKHRVSGLLGSSSTPASKAATALRETLASIKDTGTRAFLLEAIECFEHDLYRAAVVLSWVGALSLLYSEVVRSHLPAFNAEATKRDPKWRLAKNEDGLARMKEHDFLDIIEALSVIGKSVKDELQACLKLRNGCGHPNSLKIAESRVASHIEVLLLNVFKRF